jgi:hypothetical protein
MTTMRAALGWSVHTGWAVVVGVRLDGETPRVELRHRVELISPELPRMAYHAAQDLPLASAESLLADVERSVEAATASALTATATELQATGGEPGIALLGKPTADLPPLERILASHSLLHTAEGVLYRDAIVDAASTAGLTTTVVDPRTAAAEADDAWGWTPGRGEAWAAEVGKAMGPPWQKDHKLATLAALVALQRS